MRAARTTLLAVLGLLLLAPSGAQALVGGTPTNRDLPHMVALEMRSTPSGTNWRFICGGSLVAPDVVLTAAHCVSGDESDGEPDTFPAAQFRVLAGTKVRSQGGERIQAVEIREHPNYDGDANSGHDVALIKLERSSTLGRPIRIAGAADAAFFAAGKQSVVTGWGANVFQVGPTADRLEEITVPIRSDAECRATSTFPYDPTTQLCAGETQGGEDSCQGDSGGPLMVPDASGRLVLVGDVSLGFGCAFPTQYGIYGNLTKPGMRSFIDEGIAQLSSAGGQTTATPVGEPAAPAPSGGGGTAPPPSGDGSTPPATSPGSIVLPARLGSARRAVRTGRMRIIVFSRNRLRAARVVIVRGGRTVAVGRLSSLKGRRIVTLRIRRGLRAGKATLRLSARTTSGRTARASRTVRVRR